MAAEKAESARINAQEGVTTHGPNAAAGAQQTYQDRRAVYHHGICPDRYVKWVFVERAELLIGSRIGATGTSGHQQDRVDR